MPHYVGWAAPSIKTRNKNSSKFYITYDTMRDLDQWNVVFGTVPFNRDALAEIESYGSDNGTP